MCCFLLHTPRLEIKEMWLPVWVGWDQLINYKSSLHRETVLEIDPCLSRDWGGFLGRDWEQDEDWRMGRNDALNFFLSKSGVCQTSGANNIANELWKFLIKLKMPPSSFLVVPAELNSYCCVTIQPSVRAETNGFPRVSPRRAAWDLRKCLIGTAQRYQKCW